MHLRDLDILGLQSRHAVSFLRSISCGFEARQVFLGMQPPAAPLSYAGNVQRVVAEAPGEFLCHQQYTACTVAYRAAIVKVHRPGHDRVSLRISEKLLLIFPVRHGLSLLPGPFNPVIHDVADREVELSVGIQTGIVMALDGDVHKVLSTGSISGEVSGCCGSEHARECETRSHLVGDGRHCQALCHFLGAAFRHLLQTACKDNVVEPRSYGEDSFPEGKGARGAGTLRPGCRLGCEPDQVRDYRSPVSLLHKEIVREIPEVESVDVPWIYAFVDGRQHLAESFGEQVLRVLVPEHAEP